MKKSVSISAPRGRAMDEDATSGTDQHQQHNHRQPSSSRRMMSTSKSLHDMKSIRTTMNESDSVATSSSDDGSGERPTRRSRSPLSSSSESSTPRMPKSKSMMQMGPGRINNNNNNNNGNNSRGGETPPSPSFSPSRFDEEAVRQRATFLKAVRAGRTKKVTEMLAKDFAHSSTKGKGEETIEKVIRNGGRFATLATVSDTGTTPLHVACAAGHAEIAIRLLAHGADPLARDAEAGATPIMVAARRRDMLDVLRTMLSRAESDEAAANKADRAGNTAMHHACARGNIEQAAALVAAGADLDVANQDGDTPLHLATRQQKSKMVMWLLSKGADRDAINKAGIRAPLLAKKGKVKQAFVAFSS
jgi:hypothetical protein